MNTKGPLDSLFSPENSGGMRAFLFAKFYEDILRKYLDYKGYEVCPGKPKIYWSRIPLPQRQIAGNWGQLIDALKEKQRSGVYCIPDGLLIPQGRYIVWEAKNWVQELWYAPFSGSVWGFPQLLAKEVEYQGQPHLISGFLLSWWDTEEGLDKAVAELREGISPLSLDVIFTKDVLRECITAQYDWYTKLVREKQGNINQFFDILLGKASSE